jgi:hypothetical protein
VSAALVAINDLQDCFKSSFTAAYTLFTSILACSVEGLDLGMS